MSNTVIALLLGSILWSVGGWLAHPHELWDVSGFWLIWGVGILIAGALGLTPHSRPALDTGFVFLPILGVLTISSIITGGSASLLPLGLIAVAILALPGWGLARILRRLRD
jgi:hypothetical protein